MTRKNVWCGRPIRVRARVARGHSRHVISSLVAYHLDSLQAHYVAKRACNHPHATANPSIASSNDRIFVMKLVPTVMCCSTCSYVCDLILTLNNVYISNQHIIIFQIIYNIWNNRECSRASVQRQAVEIGMKKLLTQAEDNKKQLVARRRQSRR